MQNHDIQEYVKIFNKVTSQWDMYPIPIRVDDLVQMMKTVDGNNEVESVIWSGSPVRRGGGM